MAQSNGDSPGLIENIRSAASRNPATEHLLSSAEGYLGAQSERLLGSLGEKVSGATRKLSDVASGAAEPSSLLGRTAQNVAQGDSPVKAAAKGAVGGVTEKVKDKVKGIFGKGKAPSGRKSMNIEESLDVGVPIRQAYNRWTQYADFPKWSKGVQSVNQEAPNKTAWNAKIFLSKRNWNSTITEQIPDQRIRWTSDGPKGTVDGVVTFHELAPNLTRVLLALEYHPAGLFEKTGNLWRAQGRRVRLDFKLYRRFVMMSDEEVEGWRGEIRDGEVVRDHDEVTAEEEQQENGQGEGAEGEGPDSEGPDSEEDYGEDEGDYDEDEDGEQDYADEDESAEGDYDEGESDEGESDEGESDEDYADEDESDEDYADDAESEEDESEDDESDYRDRRRRRAS